MQAHPCQCRTFPRCVCMVAQSKWDFQPQSSPSLSAHSVPCFYWSRQCCGEKNNRNFICHWLSPLTVVSDVFYTHSTHTQTCSCTHKGCTYSPHLSTALPRLQYSNERTMEYHQDPHHYCVHLCVFVLGVSGISHAKSCKPENTDHKLPTNVSNQQPHSKPMHTHTHHATGCKKRETTYAVAHANTQTLILNCTHVKKSLFIHIHTTEPLKTATEHTVQPDTSNSLMLSLWYLPHHHHLFISQPHCYECVSIVILAVHWNYSSHHVTVPGENWAQRP